MTASRPLIQALLDAIQLACLNQREIAADSDLTPVTLSNWRTGHRNPSPQAALKIGVRLRSHAQRVERAALEVIRVATEEERRKELYPRGENDPETLELFLGDDEIG
jgi:transcriptional regulator with XRE-family HTH domain